MTLMDIDAIIRIENESFTLPWSRESYIGELNNHFANYLVVDYEGDVIAYGGIWVVFEEGHITNVAVDPEYRNAGVGHALMEELERVARQKKATRILLEVRPSNMSALALYRGMGYLDSGLRKGYYSDNNEDAIVMTKLLF
ncbi:MAG: ribosomal protein S18-alanine N-acetyltransferase [Syntrophomonadaceae bacterium]|nr:ribosomal protein S18-alanine N-acetyltransferase [Syntrophomonadaceae bacterium]